MKRLILPLALLAGAAQAEVLSAADNGFAIQHQVLVPVAPEKAYAQFLRVGQWWDGEHSWFGDASKFSIQPRAGGCFCEIDGDRQVLHMTVTYVDPGRELRMVGGLGPLQMMGLSGGMAWQFEAVEGGTRIRHSYAVSGYAEGGLSKLAVVVDRVQGHQLERLRARLTPH
ncbi:SRPBCC family protein [Gallaecimonas sp. GXIMD4217]|uniref:SRPBCC family protein n=1 Tax=Gallaecimonas sp. GXIMD4217 TaxID=3131927 RepID=UPI00311B0242